METEKLFNEFLSVSKEAWKEKITADLKGADYEKKLVWQTAEGFAVQPVYMTEDTKGLEYLQSLPGNFPFIRGNRKSGNAWKVNQFIVVDDIEKANRTALSAVKNGATSLAFDIKGKVDSNKIEVLLKSIDAEKTELNFRVENTVELPSLLEKLAGKRSWNVAEMQGSVYCDPLSGLTLTGKRPDFSLAENLFKEIEVLPGFHCLTLDAGVFHNSGATAVTEIGLALATGNVYLQYFTEKGIDVATLARRIRFSFATGSNYFMEIAKLRAFRYLWAKILEAYGLKPEEAKTYIHAVSASRNKTVYDPFVNMLRTTTETMSASLGGADSITVLPYDSIFEESDDMAVRTARNQQIILKEESFFDKVADPAAGSYYIENLTDNLIQKSWELFLEIEEKGGYVAVFESGEISGRIRKEASKNDLNVALRKQTVLGVNQFPNPTEHLEDNLSNEVFYLQNNEPISLKPYRAASALEALRRKTDLFAMKNKRPQAWMFTYGDLSKRLARAQFSGNFFAAAGYEIMNHNGFQTLEAGIEAAKKDKPEIVILCSSDEAYETMALLVFEALKDECVVVLAGYPQNIIENLKAAGMKHFVHVKSNILEELSKYQSLLGIQ
ncbi:MAG: methylmalonyl-CoA mutase small subunit [Bacteroidales bacterium]|nr:methylmalonyl-CoA mutase small subunit [Bacteroidales bacterium]